MKIAYIKENLRAHAALNSARTNHISSTPTFPNHFALHRGRLFLEKLYEEELSKPVIRRIQTGGLTPAA